MFAVAVVADALDETPKDEPRAGEIVLPVLGILFLTSIGFTPKTLYGLIPAKSVCRHKKSSNPQILKSSIAQNPNQQSGIKSTSNQSKEIKWKTH